MIDAYASYPHYYDHIAPIHEALGEGTFYVSPSTKRPGVPTRGLAASDQPLIVAGYPDLKRTRRPTIFVEHGIGENYGRTDPHYSGGVGRERVILFLCPNERVAEANREKYDVPSVVVGSPRVEWLQARSIAKDGRGEDRRDRPLRVVLSFHWNCRIHPQAGSALFDFHHQFRHWATDPSIELAGHAHPRIASRAEQYFSIAGIPFIPEFSDVVSWADVYAVDNSSTLFEAVALGLDVVVLDANSYTAEETGFRFWKYADVGPRISPGDSLPEAAMLSHNRRSGYDAIRLQAVAEIFGVVEGSTVKAVEAIRQHGSTGPTPTAHAGTEPAQPPIFGLHRATPD